MAVGDKSVIECRRCDLEPGDGLDLQPAEIGFDLPHRLLRLELRAVFEAFISTATA
jgi:hypothetical protein